MCVLYTRTVQSLTIVLICIHQSIIADAISRKEQLMRQSMKREGSPIQVPRDCGIIDLT